MASVWIWDRERVAASCAELELDCRAYLPETMLRPQAEADGLRLLRGLEGIEGQHWFGGSLKASRWWSEVPELAEWNRFLRSQGLPTAEAVPDCEELPWLAKPWAQSLTQGRWLRPEQEIWVPRVLLAVFLLVLGWQGVAMGRLAAAAWTLQSQANAKADESETIIAARQRALGSLARVRQIATLSPLPRQLELMAQATQVFAERRARLTTWRFIGEELSFTIESDNADPLFFVRHYELLGGFDNVRAERGASPRELSISMKVRP